MVRLYKGCFPGEDGEGVLVVEWDGGAKAKSERADVCDRGVESGEWFTELFGVCPWPNEHAKVEYGVGESGVT